MKKTVKNILISLTAISSLACLLVAPVTFAGPPPPPPPTPQPTPPPPPPPHPNPPPHHHHSYPYHHPYHRGAVIVVNPHVYHAPPPRVVVIRRPPPVLVVRRPPPMSIRVNIH